MSQTRDLLIEIGTEELPPRALRRLSNAFAEGVEQGFRASSLPPSAVQAWATPRRLALLVQDLPVCQPDQENTRRGPALNAAFDDEGCPTRAATGFARSCGVEVEQLERLETGKGGWLAWRTQEKGQEAAALIPSVVETALAALPIPKRMRWGSRDEEFVRPVHWVVLLFGDEVIEHPVLGVPADRYTRGHRFHHPEKMYLAEPQAYLPLLETEGYVLADLDTRREAIRAQVMEQAKQLDGHAIIDPALLDEVTALVEWPVALSGHFDEDFLQVPSEALISSMQDHQKYFPVIDQDSKLMPHFITVANIVSKDPQQIRSGNERVIRPRLADAAFFWKQDCSQPLHANQAALRKMVFQERLGTLYDKQERVAELAAGIATSIGADPQQARRAAQLSKCDLVSNMVYEFPELQGIMGRYYASHDGEPAPVATAIEEHYQPRFAGDRLPPSATGQALAIADRLDSLCGIFAAGQAPTGDRDPFALRRASLGVIRICIEQRLELDLRELLQKAAEQLPAGLESGPAVDQVFDYVMDRLRNYYIEQGIGGDLVEAVLATRPTSLLDIDRRVQACANFRTLPEAESLAAANKRISNLLRKTGQAIPASVDADKLQEDGEIELARQLAALQAQVVPLMDAGDYTPALEQLAGLRQAVDLFFDQVMVMVDDDTLRDNRLALLKNLNHLFLRVADLSRLQN